MIIFLNFAPLSYGGGAEKWIIDVSNKIKDFESVSLLDVHPKIANIYGKLVLKREYSQRTTIDHTINHTAISLVSFIPFTGEWYDIRKLFEEARLIYIRFEVLELLLLLYFGGIKQLKKTVAGIHSPYIYSDPIQFFDYLHNYVYTSLLIKLFLSKFSLIHVLNPLDEKFFVNKFNIKSTVRVPNYIHFNSYKLTRNKKLSPNKLFNILYVGELNIRKGTDLLIETMKNSPAKFCFHIAGDGPMKNEIEKQNFNCEVILYGYIKNKKLSDLYKKCDVMFLPSRAESFSLACLEAMFFGLPVISSPQIYLGLPLYIQYVNYKRTIPGYVALLKRLFILKYKGNLIEHKSEIKEYFKKNFSEKIILPQLMNKVFSIGTL